MSNQSKMSCDYQPSSIVTCPPRYITLTGGSGIVDQPNGTLAVKHSTQGNRVYVRFARYVGMRDFAVTRAFFGFCLTYFTFVPVSAWWSV
jgi:hypothetical protein